MIDAALARADCRRNLASMEPERPPSREPPEEFPEEYRGLGRGLTQGFADLAVRLAAIYVVIGGGYYTWLWFGDGWFRVYVAAFIAWRLHREILWVERNVPPDPPKRR
jgi:hypothetical protein